MFLFFVRDGSIILRLLTGYMCYLFVVIREGSRCFLFENILVRGFWGGVFSLGGDFMVNIIGVGLLVFLVWVLGCRFFLRLVEGVGGEEGGGV